MSSELNVMRAELLHYMHGCGGSFPKEFNALFRNLKSWCCFNHKDTKFDSNCYKSLGMVNYIIEVVEKSIIIYKSLGIHPANLDVLVNNYKSLCEPSGIRDYNDFKYLTEKTKSLVKRFYEEVSPQLEILSCIECDRLDEAIDCFRNHCYSASTVMTVSAVESRLHELIKLDNSNVYNKRFKNATLGQIIRFFRDENIKDPDEKALQKLLPEKYYPLVNILNQYRVYSAHPKSEPIDMRIAESVLNLSFMFLTDKSLQKPSKARKSTIRKSS